MVLATVDGTGRPSTRTVLCKGIDEVGLRFFHQPHQPQGQAAQRQPGVRGDVPVGRARAPGQRHREGGTGRRHRLRRLLRIQAQGQPDRGVGVGPERGGERWPSCAGGSLCRGGRQVATRFADPPTAVVGWLPHRGRDPGGVAGSAQPPPRPTALSPAPASRLLWLGRWSGCRPDRVPLPARPGRVAAQRLGQLRRRLGHPFRHRYRVPSRQVASHDHPDRRRTQDEQHSHVPPLPLSSGARTPMLRPSAGTPLRALSRRGMVDRLSFSGSEVDRATTEPHLHRCLTLRRLRRSERHPPTFELAPVKTVADPIPPDALSEGVATPNVRVEAPGSVGAGCGRALCGRPTRLHRSERPQFADARRTGSRRVPRFRAPASAANSGPGPRRPGWWRDLRLGDARWSLLRPALRPGPRWGAGALVLTTRPSGG